MSICKWRKAKKKPNKRHMGLNAICIFLCFKTLLSVNKIRLIHQRAQKRNFHFTFLIFRVFLTYFLYFEGTFIYIIKTDIT